MEREGHDYDQGQSGQLHGEGAGIVPPFTVEGGEGLGCGAPEECTTRVTATTWACPMRGWSEIITYKFRKLSPLYPRVSKR